MMFGKCMKMQYNRVKSYNNSFLYQKSGFILSEYQSELSIGDDLINDCKAKVGSVKRYLTNGITNPAYSADWKIVYPKNMKILKNGVIEYS